MLNDKETTSRWSLLFVVRIIAAAGHLAPVEIEDMRKTILRAAADISSPAGITVRACCTINHSYSRHSSDELIYAMGAHPFLQL